MAPTAIPVPSSILSVDTSASSLPPQTRNALLAHLQDSSTIPRLNTLLTDSLTRTGWTDRVHSLALELLRSGECVNFAEVLGEVSRRASSGLGPTASASNNNSNHAKEATNGLGGERQNGINDGEGAGALEGAPDVRVPKEVVDKTVKFLKDEIEGVVEVMVDDKNTSLNGVGRMNGASGGMK